jgi:hypothetical protein
MECLRRETCVGHKREMHRDYLKNGDAVSCKR